MTTAVRYFESINHGARIAMQAHTDDHLDSARVDSIRATAETFAADLRDDDSVRFAGVLAIFVHAANASLPSAR
jgi:hypothetical protein